MSLEASYEVLKMLQDDGVQSFRAKEIATGRILELHLFPPFGRPENKVLYEKLKGLPLEARRPFLDMGTDGSTPYLVTDPLPEGHGFKSWAEPLLAGTKTIAPTAPPPRPYTSSSPFPADLSARDDSVQILQAGQWRTGTPIPDSLKSKPAPPPPTGGDYTVMFQPPASPARPNQPAAEEGEFTRLFQQRVQQREPEAASQEPSPQASETPEPGEFTRMFQNLQPKPAGTNAAPQEPPPGEFTKFFESPLRPAAAPPPERESHAPPPCPPPSPSSKQVGEFTATFGARGPSATGVFAAGGQRAQAPPTPTFASEPSEYTKMMAQPAVPTLGQAPRPVPPGPVPSPAKRSNTALLIAIGAVIVLLICILLFFVFRQSATLPATK